MRTINLLLTILLLFLISGAVQAQVSNTRSVISGPGQITVTYDLVTSCGSTDVTLYYSPNKCDWYEAVTVSGALTSQTTGNDKQIIWDNAADHVTSGKIYFKVVQDCDEGVVINGVRWATRNLDTGGVFVANEYDYGALYQWGRQADGHESVTWNANGKVATAWSDCFTTTLITSACGTNASTQLADVDLDINGQPSFASGARGKFIRQNTGNMDWLVNQNNALWNSGDETSPVKTVNDPCPAGWRVPTTVEFAKIADASKVTYTEYITTPYYNNSGVQRYGVKFTDISNPSASVFFPAPGVRVIGDGTMNGVGSYGYYWSSIAAWNISAHNMYIDDEEVDVEHYNVRAHGFSIRCVKDE